VSVEAITWALATKTPSSSSKFILVALANCARAEDGCAWPSIAYLCDATQQNRKTVITNLGRLEEKSLIRKVGVAGRTKQVNVYQLALRANSPKNGTGTKSGIVPVLPDTSTAFTQKQSQICAPPVPKTGHGTVMNHKGTERDPSEPIDPPAAADAAPPAAAAMACPHQKILKLWEELLPELPQHNAARWGGTRADALRARWTETASEKGWADQDAGLKYFAKLFRWIRQSDFLMGKRDPTQGRRRMEATLEWATTRSKWDRLIEGYYHDPAVTEDVE